jgi:hypothetical protein
VPVLGPEHTRYLKQLAVKSERLEQIAGIVGQTGTLRDRAGKLPQGRLAPGGGEKSFRSRVILRDGGYGFGGCPIFPYYV